jgi:hypothetical protein
MESFAEALLKGLFGTRETIQVEVMLPPGANPMDLYTTVKEAIEQTGCTLTDFQVVKESS